MLRTLEIIDYFKPKFWFIENPDGGKLKEQPFMRDLPYHRVSYCMYGPTHANRYINMHLNTQLVTYCDYSRSYVAHRNFYSVCTNYKSKAAPAAKADDRIKL